DPGDLGRPLLHVRPDGGGYPPGLGGARRHDAHPAAAPGAVLQPGAGRQSSLRPAWCGSTGERASIRRQHGRQGGALRHRQFHPLGGDDDGGLERLGELDARLLHAARRPRAALPHAVQRGGLRRRRLRVVRHADLRARHGLHRRPDGRPHAGVPGQEGRGLRDEDGLAGHPHHAVRGADLHRPRGGREAGPRGDLQPASSRFLRGALRLHVAGQQQWQRLRGPGRQQPVLQHDRRHCHGLRPLLAGHPRPGNRRVAGEEEAGPGRTRDAAHPHPSLHRLPDRRRRAGGGADLLPGAGARPHRRAPADGSPHPRPLSRKRARGEQPAGPPDLRFGTFSLCSPLPLAGEGPGVRAMSKRQKSLFDPRIVRAAIKDSFRKLDPRLMVRNPVMFVVYIGSFLTTGLFIPALVGQGEAPAGFILGVSLWLWFTVLFANFAEAMAEGRGKAQAAALRQTRKTTIAKKLKEPRQGAPRTEVASTELRKGDVVLVEAGDTIPGDGEVIEGAASVNEAAVTGESAPVIRESGGDRSSVTGGTQVLSDWLIVRITANPGETFLDRMISLVEGARRQKTPNEIALSILLAALTLIFLIATVTLLPFSIYSVTSAGAGTPVTVTVLTALLVCLIPTTIGGLLSAIGIAGMDRMIQANVI